MFLEFLILIVLSIVDSFIFLQNYSPKLSYQTIFANPVNCDGNHFRGSVTEEEAFMWFDEAFVHVRGGSGGAGSNAYKFGKSRQHLGPTGGSGGNGGSVYLVADPSFNTLLKFRGNAHFRAENGFVGSYNFANGLFGADQSIAVPPGTTVKDNSTGELIGELINPNDRLLVASGGLGGHGNSAVRLNRGDRSICKPPQGGQRRWIKLELNLVADIGLVGVPNAGKSTLLDAVTNARPKIADYPFTTIVPNLGVCVVPRKDNINAVSDNTMVIADIPGLLEGAHRGVGLGRGFLRHIERCKMILHIVNGDSVDAVSEFTSINNELQLFSPKLASKPQVVVLNKIDIPSVAANEEVLLNMLRQHMSHTRLVVISAAKRTGVDNLVTKCWHFLKKIQADIVSYSTNSDIS